MSKNIWIDNLLLFKILKIFSTQYLCVSSQEYITELDMKVGDIIFMKIKPNSYKRLGEIKAFKEKKVIVSVMSDIGIRSKTKMEELHNKSLNEEGVSEEVENDGTLYGGKKRKNKTFKKRVKHRKSRKYY